MPFAQLPPWLRYAVVLTALALIVYEAVGYHGEPRYWLLVLYAAMIGLPSLFGIDAKRNGDPPTPPAPPVPPAPAAPPKDDA